MNARCKVCTLHHRPKCPGTKQNRWPLAPLLDAVPGHSYRALMARLPISGSALTEAARDGLTDRQADHWAIALGTHPSLVWDGWDRAGLTVIDDVFVNTGGWRHGWAA